MAPRQKDKGEEKSFIWNDEVTKELLLICRNYQKKHGHDQPFSWLEIIEEFVAKTRKKCQYTIPKNKFDHMKQIWRLWTDLRYNETGIGWEASIGRVMADDAWWDKKLKENDKYKHFRRKGVAPEISELWDQIYGSIVATGRHCMAPCMDPSAQTDLALMLEAPYGDVEGVNDERLNEHLNFQQLLSLDGSDDDVLASVHNVVIGGSSSSLLPSQSKEKNSTCSSLKPFKSTMKKKSSATIYNQHLQLMGERGEKMLSLLQEDMASSSLRPTGKSYELEDVMVVVNAMVAEGSLPEDSLLWCFAVSELRNEESRKAFMNVPKNSGRIAWLKYEMESQKARLGGK